VSRDGRFQAPILRAALAAIAVADLFSFVQFLYQARTAALAHGSELARFGALLSQPLVAALVALIGAPGPSPSAPVPGGSAPAWLPSSRWRC